MKAGPIYSLLAGPVVIDEPTIPDRRTLAKGGCICYSLELINNHISATSLSSC